MSAVSPERLANVFVELADTLIDEFDVISFLEMLAERVTELTAATATGLLLADEQRRLHFVAASDERMENLELFQVQADEGPCLDSFHLGVPVINADLTVTPARWPRFAPHAVAAGLRSVHAFPLRLRQQILGTLGLFSSSPIRLAQQDVAVVQAMADVATIGLLQERAVRHGEQLTAQLRHALDSRILIEQAKGILAQSFDIGIADAFTLLRTYCRNNHLRIRDVAQDLVDNRGTTQHLQLLGESR